MARASAQIDGYLVGRYRTPWPDSPGILVGYCCDIARYHLATDYRISSEEIQMRYRDAIRFLEKVAAGQINLGRDTSGSVIRHRHRCVSAPAPVSSGVSPRGEVHSDY
ncbi:gp436 family protein [Escherichia coli]|uniref:gp436 family protein n=1 Tax=Escherichia coli TaxID=562 RepID=UPI003D9C7B1D